MKVLLLFPPSWHPSQPYLSLPSLTAFLKHHGVCGVVQRDLNIELLDVLLTRKKCNELYQRMVDKLRSLEDVPPVHPVDEEKRSALAHAVKAIPSIIDKIEYAKNTLRSEDFYDLAKYMEGVHVVNKYLGMEKDSPLTHNPAEYGISSIMSPKSEDLGLGYFYEVERGMSVEDAEQMYHHVIGKLSDELCPFPYNYSMSDGLLYIVDSKKRSGDGAGAVGKMPAMP